jgi:hypothetical protein
VEFQHRNDRTRDAKRATDIEVIAKASMRDSAEGLLVRASLKRRCQS